MGPLERSLVVLGDHHLHQNSRFFLQQTGRRKRLDFQEIHRRPKQNAMFLRASLRQKIASSAVLLFLNCLLFFNRFWALSACWHTQEWLTKTHLLRNLSKTNRKSRVLGPPGGQAWLCVPPGGPKGLQNAQKNVAPFFMVTCSLLQIYRFLSEKVKFLQLRFPRNVVFCLFSIFNHFQHSSFRFWALSIPSRAQL